jgi:hypothetical protein
MPPLPCSRSYVEPDTCILILLAPYALDPYAPSTRSYVEPDTCAWGHWYISLFSLAVHVPSPQLGVEPFCARRGFDQDTGIVTVKMAVGGRRAGSQHACALTTGCCDEKSTLGLALSISCKVRVLRYAEQNQHTDYQKQL